MDTCPGIIGYGTPDSRPWCKWTSVPHTSEYKVRNIPLPCGNSGHGSSPISTGWLGACMIAAVTTLAIVLAVKGTGRTGSVF